ncbi:membrane protein [Salmonella enterica subsp. enterica]|uniref:Membrane protein n=1 Tax=Salmonella enterica I TaxID=59201 RepID=A0A379X0L6_SALET|nr:membrane protein [Salmonella enterica subsp. enterica]
MKSNSKWLGIAICCIFTALLPPSARADDDCQITFSSPNVSFGWLKQDDIVQFSARLESNVFTGGSR